jgi:hypothetical protein
LDAALPEGLDVVDVVVAGPGSLADRLEASRWQVSMPEVAPAELARAVERFLAAGTVEVERMTKSGLRRFDCRAAVVSLEARVEACDFTPCAILEMVVRHGTPAVRPDDILAGISTTAGLEVPVAATQIRIAQGPLDGSTGSVLDPLDHDRDAL